jgi:hypothetical protein
MTAKCVGDRVYGTLLLSAILVILVSTSFK